MKIAIEVKNLAKSYVSGKGYINALDKVTFQIEQGEFVALIGPDGAGKTTLIKILCGIMNFDSGDVKVLDYQLPEEKNRIKHYIGYLSQRFSLYGNLTIEENMRYFAKVFGVENYEKRMEDLLKAMNLSSFRGRLAKKLSGGMKQKLGVICGLIHSPQILYLDEPTTGVDPVSRRELFRVIEEMVAEGLTVVMSTAYMDEAERAKKVIMFNEGKIIQEGTYNELVESAHCKVLAIETEQSEQVIERIARLDGIRFINPVGNIVQLLVDDRLPFQDVKTLLDGLEVKITTTNLSMENIYINRIVQHKAENR